MRYVIALVSLIALPATAETPTLLYRFGCFGDQIIVQFKVESPGIYEIAIPHKTCGVSI